MLDIATMQVSYQEAQRRGENPGTMIIHCDYCHRAHYATRTSNDICQRLTEDIREAQKQAGIFTAERGLRGGE